MQTSVISYSSGSVLVGVTGTPGTLVRFEDDARRLTSVRIPASGTNTVSIRVDDNRVTNFTVTSVLDGERVDTPWSVDTRTEDPGTPGDPGDPGDQGSAPKVVVAGYAHGYATLAVSGKAGQTYSVTDAAGHWAGSGVLGDTAKNVSVEAPAGVSTKYTVSLKENYEVVGSTTVVVNSAEAPDPEQPVTPEPGNPGEEPEVPVEPGNPDQPGGPDQPGDSVVGDVSVGTVAGGRAAITISGPIGAQFMISDESGGYVTGGFIEGRSVTRQIVVGTGSVRTFTLHMAGGTKTFTVDAR
ncbi:hypothetical protein BIU98_06145 [Curtobacterium sp. MMLR14_010]|nr:hypothetical protein BIU98_06145 [Curtobacterium sp. MMLR14_010]